MGARAREVKGRFAGRGCEAAVLARGGGIGGLSQLATKYTYRYGY